MSISAVFGSAVLVVPNSSAATLFKNGGTKAAPWSSGGGGGLVIECSSRPQKKATAHHRKTRPRKSQPWDINRKPTVYAPLPPLPADWTLVSSAPDDANQSLVAPASTQAPPTNE